MANAPRDENRNAALLGQSQDDATVTIPVQVNPSTGGLEVEMSAGDSASVDSFSRFRVAAPFGIFDSKFISSRAKSQWEERLTGCIMNISSVTGTPTAGDTITGGTSGASGVVTGVAGTVITYTSKNNDWTDTETVTFAGVGPGATAVVDNHNTGADLVYNYDESGVDMNLGTVSGQKVIRQSHRYHAYVPGKSQLILMTFVLGTKANTRRRVGYFDDLNGLFLEDDGTNIKFVVRSSTSGSPVDTAYNQSNWNLDTLDGTGASGITLDITKTHILVIDFQWLGVGRVRYGFDIDGNVIYCHEVKNANNLDKVYMKTPTLPVRYEIENTGTAASASTIQEICSSVASEGGYALPGLEFSAGLSFAQQRAITTRTPILAIRLKSAYPTGEPNRRQVRFLDSELYTTGSGATFEIAHIHDPSAITATWSSAHADSSVEVSRDISAVTGDPEHIIQGPINVFSGQANKGDASAITAEFISAHSFISQNYESDNSQMFVIYATSQAGTANVSCHISWIEFE